MNHQSLKNNKGVVLIVWYFALAVLLGLSAVAFQRSAGSIRISQRNSYSMEAFWEAEAGISYAYAELVRHRFHWYTHEDRNTPVAASRTLTDPTGAEIDVIYPVDLSPDIIGASIDPNTNCYRVGGKNFQVKTYPERYPPLTGDFTGIVVVLSQAEVNGVRRSIEYRLAQRSVYENLLFSPGDHNFPSATFDGRNFGGIHVNGDINLLWWQQFRFLTQLTSGSNIPDKGFMYRPLRGQYPDLHGEVDYEGSAANPQALPFYLYNRQDAHFNPGRAVFTTGDYNTPNADIELEYFVDNTLYPGAEWRWDKYEGDGLDTTSAHYNIIDDNLRDLAKYELGVDEGSFSLLDDNEMISIPDIGDPMPEPALFALMESDHSEEVGLWTKFWDGWRKNHEDDWQDFHANGTLTEDGEWRDWERRFFWAAYNWVDANSDGIPDGINREWWEDLSYGDDRASLIDDMALAQTEDEYTGEKQDRYTFNTREQPAAWAAWLEEHNLNEAGENMTLVQDRSQGGRYLDPGNVLSEEHTNQMALRQRAQSGGIYIGLNDEGAFENPISDFTVETQFYNVYQPAAHYALWDAYRPSNFLVVDMHALKEALEDCNSELNQDQLTHLQCNFNGIIYIDLEGTPWSNATYDKSADGVMLVNGEVLPEGGLSIVTPNNVVIKGNYNLDPDGVSQKNRDPDDPEVIDRVIAETHQHRLDGSTYQLNLTEDDPNCLKWQPADIITSRAVYTASEDFAEPSYMPMAENVFMQYHEERYGHVLDEDGEVLDFVSGDHTYPTNNWVPDVASTRQANPDTVDLWFEHYYTGEVPTRWSSTWVEDNWPSNELFAMDTDAVPGPDTYILGRALRSDVEYQIAQAYNDTYNFETIHGSDGSLNPGTPSLINKVSKKHIYNAAIVTPYDTAPYVLEYWRYYDPVLEHDANAPRVINGAFIQLPAEFRDPLPSGAYWSRIRDPGSENTFGYESRFGRGAHASDRPPAGLIFGSDSSWREINAANF